MNSLRTVSSLACMLGVTLALGCNPTVTEAPEDDVGDDTTSDDDDDETVSDDGSSTGESGTETTSSDDATSDDATSDDSTSADDTADTTTATTDDTTDDTTDATTDDTTDTEDAKHVCGWDVREEYYWCGSMGVDPSDEFPISCEEIGFPMVPGAPCEEKLGYEGCCDANGDAWYCYQGLLEYEICGAG